MLHAATWCKLVASNVEFYRNESHRLRHVFAGQVLYEVLGNVEREEEATARVGSKVVFPHLSSTVIASVGRPRRARPG